VPRATCPNKPESCKKGGKGFYSGNVDAEMGVQRRGCLHGGGEKIERRNRTGERGRIRSGKDIRVGLYPTKHIKGKAWKKRTREVTGS